MLKRFFGITMAVLFIVSAMAGCGSGKTATATAPQYAADQAANNSVRTTFTEEMDAVATAAGAADVFGNSGQAGSGEAKEAEAPAAAQEEAIDSLAGTGNTIENTSNAILAERKIIRSANLTIEVENFDEACNNINSIILGIGIVQESNITTDKIYVEDKVRLIKRGTIVLRVNKDKFDSVVNNLKGIGEVYNQQINGQDVTDRYIDTESKLRLLKLEQSKLEAYLLKLDDLEQIFRIESKLTEIRQEIESLTGNLKKMGSLVELSTITLTLNEKHPDADKKQKPETYWDRLLESLKSSMEGVITFLGNLLIFLIAAIPVLVVLGLFVLLGVFLYRRIPRKKKMPYAAPYEAPKNNVETKKDDQQ